MSLKKRVKRLENVKGKTTRVGVGTPTSLEGKNGDIHVRETPTGVALFGKLNGRWHKFSSVGTDISKITDNTTGDITNIVNYTSTSAVSDDVASLAAKINEIIDRLK